MRQTKIIIDTNIWITYFLSQRFDAIANLILDSNTIVYSSWDLVKELKDVLSREKLKKQITLPIDRYINFHLNLVTVIETEKIFENSPDENDNFLFDLAIQTNSKILVTGDKKLLAFEAENLEIITLKSFKERIEFLN